MTATRSNLRPRPAIIRRLFAILLLPFIMVVLAPERLRASISQFDWGWRGPAPADSQSDWVGTEPAVVQIDRVETAVPDQLPPPAMYGLSSASSSPVREPVPR